MQIKEFLTYLESLKVKPDSKVSLKNDFHTDYDDKMFSKEEGQELLKWGIDSLSQMQDILYAHNQISVLIILQAMDAAGKDSAIKHVMSGLNPQGVSVTSFKTPNSTELDHDYLWRHYSTLPPKGNIGIFNRSHYENVLVTKVHPEYILQERLPGISDIKDLNEEFWKNRYKQINRFEKNLAETGTLVLKFFLYVCKNEQKKRFLERIEDPSKNWKFSMGDLAERKLWKEYMKAYEEALEATSTKHAPWYVIPADDKWFTRLCLGGIIHQEFKNLEISYPIISNEQKSELENAKNILLSEED
jgi:PPK2 family polyphosphate:nucleotide phosphotransferase